MPSTFQERQREMKRLKTRRTKAERRVQSKFAKRMENEALSETVPVPAKSEAQS